MREGLDFVVEDVEGGGCHGSVVEAVDFVELDGGVSAEAEHTPKVGVSSYRPNSSMSRPPVMRIMGTGERRAW